MGLGLTLHCPHFTLGSPWEAIPRSGQVTCVLVEPTGIEPADVAALPLSHGPMCYERHQPLCRLQGSLLLLPAESAGADDPPGPALHALLLWLINTRQPALMFPAGNEPAPTASTRYRPKPWMYQLFN